ncbi:MAG: ATP-dependent helicase HrpA, partial [Acidimicrobiaceae bacterium]|nr:ATP-dependent helicase HrpA [Acidimicrobiaceae bacterium]
RTALADVRHQVAELIGPGFVASTGASRLPQLLRYLEAAQRRLERLPADARRDAERLASVGRVRSRYERLAAQRAGGGAQGRADDELAAIRWMIEDLRVSLWAQSLGTPAPVSEERILRAMDRLDS